MKKQTILTIVILVAFILFFVLNKFGFTSISQIGSGAFTIAIFISCLSNIKTINKKRFAISMSILIAPILVLIYAFTFDENNSYLVYGSLICVLLSLPIGRLIVHSHL